ncbi:2766_t:CDS:1 [Ambispora gerdemannii]|uniref:6,7-dimethyl-8-ribityllumazine synthase n=1 Tax=Ambispora gerdemannii TaxID=144530 RepID=A0A9N8VNL5_9GLOM|nr:2766_t:CDS:1 [Ambispora gerdemannii]
MFTKGVTPSETPYDGSEFRILILHTRWNLPVVEALVTGARETLLSEFNVKMENISIKDVPGSYELPFAAQEFIKYSDPKFNAVICIGVLIKGSTMHFEYIAEATAHGIMRVGLDTRTPCVFGVLTCLTDEQALERAGLGESPSKHNHGIDWARCAVELAVRGQQGWPS